MFRFFFIISISLASARTKFEPKVVEGDLASISSYAHSVFLTISDYSGNFVCGSSIVNQKILLTAAHCIDSCDDKCWDVNAYAGSANKRQGYMVPISKTYSHQEFDRQTIRNDIGLVSLERPLPLGKLITRVALLRNPPQTNVATIAGWGLINELQSTHTDHLHSIKQTVWSWEECVDMISIIPEGTMCAGDKQNRKYASEGDSGSALIANDYIEIGIVSFKRPDISRGVVVYTNVSYFYDWIKKNSKKLYCGQV